MAILNGFSILEIGDYVAAPFAGKLFSDLGAEVLKIEPPQGDVARTVGPFTAHATPDASAFFGYLNTGKKSIQLPQDATAPTIIREFIEQYEIDLVITSPTPAFGIDPPALESEYDRLSVVSITGFGATGPFADYEAPDLVAWAESGHMNKMGYPDSPPTRPRIKTMEYWAGQMAAISGLASLANREFCDEPGQFVDVAKRECGTSAMEFFITGYSWSGESTQRRGDGYPDQGTELGYPTIFETKDGYVSAALFRVSGWESFAREMLDQPELAEDPRFSTSQSMRHHSDVVKDIVEEYTKERSKRDLVAEFQAHGIPSAITSTPADLMTLEHLQERDFWQDVPLPNGETVTMPGFPYRPNGPDSTVRMERAPRLGEHTTTFLSPLGYDATILGNAPAQSSPAPNTPRANVTGKTSNQLPLEGIRILDFTWVYAGPVATKYLAAFGADVVKVESARKPDFVRNSRGYDEFDPEENINVSAYYNEQNLGKRDIQLDLTTDRGQDLALGLMKEADVVIENFSPSFMDRVGLDYSRISAINPEIIYCSMPGWGKKGPARTYRSFGLNLQSAAGLDWVSGHPDDPPTTTGFSWPDPTAGFMAITAIFAELLNRQQTGDGAFIEVPQFETTLSFLHKPLTEYEITGDPPERTGNRDEDTLFVQGAYPCAGTDTWIAIAIRTDTHWEQLCNLFGRPELATDTRFVSHYNRLENHDALDAIIANWTETKSAEEVRTRLQHRGIPAGIVANEQDLVVRDPQLRARNYFTEHAHPVVGEQTYQGIPFKMSGTPVMFQTRAPLFGEHTDEVLTEWLGLAAEEIRAAKDDGALH